MASGVKAGKAYVEIYGDNNPLSKALRKSGRMMEAWGAKMRAVGLGMAAAGMAALGPLLAASRSFAKTGDDIAKMAKRIGASTEFISALGYAAEEGGTDIAAMETGLRRLAKFAHDAANGSKDATEAFGSLGVNVRDANGNLKGTETLFRESATALAAVENNTTKAALAQKLFGRSGTALLPMLHDGADGLDAAMNRADEFGRVWSEIDTRAAEELTDAMLRIKSVANRLWTTIGGALAPALTKLGNGLAKLIAPAAEWIRANGAIVQIMAAGAFFAVSAGVAMTGLGIALGVAGKVAIVAAAAIGAMKIATAALLSTTLATKIGTLAMAAATTAAKIACMAFRTAIVVTKAMLVALTATTSVTKIGMLALAAATTAVKLSLLGVKLAALAILSAPALIAAGLVTLAVNFKKLTSVASQSMQWIGEQFQWLRQHAIAAFQGISDAMAGGDLGLAFKVAWSAAMVVWYEYTQKMRETWADVQHWIMSQWDEVRYFLADTFSELSGLWTDTTGEMNSQWSSFCADLKSAFATLVEWFKSAWNWVQKKATEGIATVFAYAQGHDPTQVRQAARETIGAYQRGEWKPASGVPRAAREAREATRRSQIEAASTDLAEAQSAFEAALAAARESRLAAEAKQEEAEKAAETPAFDPEEFGKRSTSVRGTFSAAAVAGLGSQNDAKKTAENTWAIAQNTKTLIDRLANLAPVFD